MTGFIGRTPEVEGKGIGRKVAFTPLSDARAWGLGAKGDVWDEAEWSVVGRLFSLQEQNREGIISLACWCRLGCRGESCERGRSQHQHQGQQTSMGERQSLVDCGEAKPA